MSRWGIACPGPSLEARADKMFFKTWTVLSRSDEHFYYFTASSFITFMKAFGFNLLEQRDDEIRIGRDSIYTFVFRKKI